MEGEKASTDLANDDSEGWSTVQKQSATPSQKTRRLVPQFSLSRQDLGTGATQTQTGSVDANSTNNNNNHSSSSNINSYSNSRNARNGNFKDNNFSDQKDPTQKKKGYNKISI